MKKVDNSSNISSINKNSGSITNTSNNGGVNYNDNRIFQNNSSNHAVPPQQSKKNDHHHIIYLADLEYNKGYELNNLSSTCHHAIDDEGRIPGKRRQCLNNAKYFCETCTIKYTKGSFPILQCFSCVGPPDQKQDNQGHWLLYTNNEAHKDCYHYNATTHSTRKERNGYISSIRNNHGLEDSIVQQDIIVQQDDVKPQSKRGASAKRKKRDHSNQGASLPASRQNMVDTVNPYGEISVNAIKYPEENFPFTEKLKEVEESIVRNEMRVKKTSPTSTNSNNVMLQSNTSNIPSSPSFVLPVSTHGTPTMTYGTTDDTITITTPEFEEILKTIDS